MKKLIRTTIAALVLGLGIWTLAVTFSPIVSNFQSGEQVSANAFNALFNAIDANFTAAKTAIDALEAASGLTLPFTGTTADSGPAFSIANTGSGNGVKATATGGRGIEGISSTGIGVFGISDTRAIVGTQGSTSCAGTYAVGGCATTGNGVFGRAGAGNGVEGSSDSGRGVEGSSNTGIGVIGISDTRAIVGTQGSTSCAGTYAVGGCATTGNGVFGHSNSGLAGFFDGDVTITGTLAKGSGSFKIDHPLDPENQYLYHSFVESPDMMNIYNGNVTLDQRGSAVVAMPDWFEALNQEFRYQLTAIGAPGPNLYVAETIKDNSFTIAGGAPGMEVSWQVTGIRHDPFAEANRIVVEVPKPAAERGTYLHPEAYGLPPERGLAARAAE